MKTNKLLIFFAIISIGFVSCDLTENPYGFYTDENFFQNPEDAQSALYSAYNALTYREYCDVMFFMNDIATEQGNYPTTGSFGVPELDFWNYHTFRNNDQLEFIFKYCYIGINRANSIIDNLQDSKFDASVKNQILGQAHFLRAYHYFYLIRTFGLVPVQKHSVSTVDQTQARLAIDLDELYDLVIDDLEIAASLMVIDKKPGLADKVAAQSLLSKVYLNIASSKESDVNLYKDMNKDIQAMYDSASVWSRKVLYDQNDYYIDPDLLNIYNVEKPDGPEHIFILGKDKTGKEGWNYSVLAKMFMPGNSNQPLYFLRPDSTYLKNVYGYGSFQYNDDFVNTFDPDDKRRKYLITKEYYADDQGATKKVNAYYLSLKYTVQDWLGNGITSSKPYLIRFSDIALVYAEAEGPTTEGYKWLNKIRNRAGLDDAPEGMSVADFRNYVVQERSFELTCEANRLFDLRRKAMVTTTDPYALLSGISESEAAFYPIPQKEVDLNVNIQN
jgi:hypothetical protein